MAVNVIAVPRSNVRYNVFDHHRLTEVGTSMPLLYVSPHVSVAQVFTSVHYADRVGYVSPHQAERLSPEASADQSEYQRWCCKNTRLYLCGQGISLDGDDEDARYLDAAEYVRAMAFSTMTANVREALRKTGILFKAPKLRSNDAKGVFETWLRRRSVEAYYAHYKVGPYVEVPSMIIGRLVEVMATTDEEGKEGVTSYLEAEFGS